MIKKPGFLSSLAMTILLLASTLCFASLQSQLAHFHSLSATFEQTLTSKNGPSQHSTGKVWIQKPGQFRWQVNKPNQQLYVSDGKQLWNYEADLSQVTVLPLDQQLSQTPLLLLSGKVANIDQLFRVRQLSTNRYQLMPRKQDTFIRQIDIQFSDHVLQALQFTNTMGQTSTIRFSNVALNQSLSKSLFQFKVPKGVDVLH